MFGWELPPNNSGGLGVACYGMAKALAKKGVNISFVLPRKLDDSINFMNVLGNKIRNRNLSITAINSLLKSYSTTENYSKLLSNLTDEEIDAMVFASNLVEESKRFGQIAKRWAKTVNHDVIHMHDWMTYPAGMNAAKVSGKPLIAHIHATEFDRCASNHVNGEVAEIEYQGLQKADKVIAVSDFTKRMVVDKYLVNPKNVEVVHNGVELDEFPVSTLPELLPGYQVVLFIGRLTVQKGPDYFLKAAKLVLQKMPKTIFIMAGDGDMHNQLVMEAAALGIADKVLFPGFVRGEERAHLFQQTDVFVMPSVSEPFGIVPLEAMANKKPVIISKQSGVSEVINHGFKVDFWNVEKMADLIIASLRYPELNQEMSKNGYREAQGQTWDNAAEQIKTIYKHLTLGA